ncbi:hypothetical protein EPR50_G00193510 [Perca flavescens]|uniref:Lens epithelium-derived growth factor integrase-binding domain-containing protein n=1 Tax=Perca flavescens TaxID=8167 RepID=A0A484C7D1_PERFV|nr:hypothetical protein EPR50_G00193510 [Perca flavescens]
MTLTDSTLHRIHGDIRISLKTDNPDISKCLVALDQLSMVYVTSKHVQRHSELVATLRKLRFYRASQPIMDKASMLYNRLKNSFLVGEGEEVVSAAFLHSLLQEKEAEEAQRVERYAERRKREELLQEVKRRMGQVKERREAEGGEEVKERREAEGGEEVKERRESEGGEEVMERRDTEGGEEVMERRDTEGGEEVKERREAEGGEEVMERRESEGGEEVKERRESEGGEEVKERRESEGGESLREERR